MALIHAFCRKLGLQRLLQRCLRPVPRSRDYQTAELLLALRSAIIVGRDRINATQLLEYNGAFQQIVGLPGESGRPSATALGVSHQAMSAAAPRGERTASRWQGL